jgi:anti-sigma factor RsiW
MADEQGNMPSDEALWRRLAPRGRQGGAEGAGPCPAPGDLAAFIDGRASPPEQQRIEQHLAECPDCLAALREARDILAAGPAVAPRRLVARAKALVPAAAARPRVRWRVAARWAASAAAAVVIGLAGFFAGASTYRSREATETTVAREVSFGLADGADEALAVEAYLFEPAGEGGER